MKQYIPKDTLVAEIEKLLQPVKHRLERDKNDLWDTDIEVLRFGKQLLSFIDTLEVKEVDLEKEIYMSMPDKYCWSGDGSTTLYTKAQMKDFAKHFYELGLKAQKGEKV